MGPNPSYNPITPTRLKSVHSPHIQPRPDGKGKGKLGMGKGLEGKGKEGKGKEGKGKMKGKKGPAPEAVVEAKEEEKPKPKESKEGKEGKGKGKEKNSGMEGLKMAEGSDAIQEVSEWVEFQKKPDIRLHDKDTNKKWTASGRTGYEFLNVVHLALRWQSVEGVYFRDTPGSPMISIPVS